MTKNVKEGLLKSFRGLVAEKKDGKWELSKGNVSFWGLLLHCMYVWTGTNADGGAMDVSQGELYTLWALLGYSGVKLGKDAMTAFATRKK